MIEKKDVDENTEETPVEESTEEEASKEEVEGGDAPADLNVNVGEDVETGEQIS